MKYSKIFGLISAFLLVSMSATSCGTNYSSDVTYLHVYNWQDYIYQYDPESETYQDPDMIDQFEEYQSTRKYEDLWINKKSRSYL